MQTIAPVDVHIENEWREGRNTSGSYVKKSNNTVTNRGGRQGPRMRTCVTNKTRINKSKSCHIPQQVNTQSKTTVQNRSRSPSPNREPW